MKSKKSVVWYPYCGSWFIGLVAEAILFTCVLTHGISPSAFGYAQVTVQASRMLIFVSLFTVFFTKSSKKTGTDEESASLLGHGKGESDSTNASPLGKTGYGSITITPDGEGADLEYEAELRKKHQDRLEVHEKKLQAEGNWFTYGLLPQNPTLSHPAFPSIHCSSMNPTSKPHPISSSIPKHTLFYCRPHP